MVSTVTGQPEEKLHPIDCVEAACPMGSLLKGRALIKSVAFYTTSCADPFIIEHEWSWFVNFTRPSSDKRNKRSFLGGKQKRLDNLSIPDHGGGSSSGSEALSVDKHDANKSHVSIYPQDGNLYLTTLESSSSGHDTSNIATPNVDGLTVHSLISDTLKKSVSPRAHIASSRAKTVNAAPLAPSSVPLVKALPSQAAIVKPDSPTCSGPDPCP